MHNVWNLGVKEKETNKTKTLAGLVIFLSIPTLGSNIWQYMFMVINMDRIKASELVPGNLLPPSNSMRFFARGSLYDTSSRNEVRFVTLYRQSSNTSRILKLIRYYVVIRSRTYRHCEISKKLTLNPTLSAKNTLLVLFPYMGRSLKMSA